MLKELPSPQQAVLRKGFLLKQVFGNLIEFKKRFFLFQNQGESLVFFERESVKWLHGVKLLKFYQEINDRSKTKGRVLLSDIKKINSVDELKFELVTDTKVVVLAALTKEDKDDWISAILALINQNPPQKILVSNESLKTEERPLLDTEFSSRENESSPLKTNKQQFIDENKPTVSEKQAVIINELRLDKARLEESLVTLLEDRQSLEGKIASLSNEKAELMRENMIMKFESEELKNKIALEKEKNQILLAGTQPIEELQEKEKVKLINLERMLDLERSKASTLKLEIEKTLEALKSEQKKNELLRKEILKLSQEIIEVEIKASEASTTVTQLERDLANKVEFIKNAIAKENDYAAKIETLEKELMGEREKNRNLEKEIADLKIKAELYDKKFVSDTLMTPQESEFLNLTLKLMGLESYLRLEKNRTEQLTAENDELKQQVTNITENLESKTEALLEEKSSLTFKVLNANQKNAQLQLKLERISNQLQLERDQKDSSQDNKDINAALDSFATVFSALLKNLHLGYQNFDKTEDRLLEELEKALESLPGLRNFEELYATMKEKLHDLTDRHLIELEQKENMVKSLMKKIEELEAKLSDLFVEKKTFLADSASKDQQKEETLSKILSKVEEFSVNYQSIVKNLFMAKSDNQLNRRGSVSLLFRLETAAADNKQLAPLLDLYRFLDEQIKKELLELRELKIDMPPETKSRVFMRLLSEGQRAFMDYFIQLTEHKIPIAERNERMNSLRDSLTQAKSLTTLYEFIPELQEKIENILKPLEQKVQKYEHDFTIAGNKIKDLIDESVVLREALAKSHQEHQKAQEYLRDSKQSILNLERRLVLAEEGCIMLRSLIQDIGHSSERQNTIIFDLTTSEKEERLKMIIREIPQLHELNHILEILKHQDKKPTGYQHLKASQRTLSAKKEQTFDKYNRIVPKYYSKTKIQIGLVPKVVPDDEKAFNNSFIKHETAETNQSISYTEEWDLSPTFKANPCRLNKPKSSERVIFMKTEFQKIPAESSINGSNPDFFKTADTATDARQTEFSKAKQISVQGTRNPLK